MAETKQKYKPMHPLMRSLQKKNAREMLARSKPAPEVHQEGLDEDMKLQKAKDAINKIIEHPELTPEQKKAITAGTTRAWYADFPGAPADLAGMGVDYLAEGLKSLLPSGEQAGFNIAKSLGLTAVQEGARNPILGSRHLEELGEKAGYIPPSTGTDLEMVARVGAGFVDPIPVPLFAATTAKQIAKADDVVNLNNPLSAPKDAAEKLNRKLQRTETTKAKKKKNKDYSPPGSHKNKSIILKPKKGVDLPPVQIGGQKTKNWVIKIEGVLSPEEIVEAAGWYREGKMVQPLIESAGPGLTPELQAGFMLGAVQKSPPGALLSYLKQREQVKRGVAFENRMKSGTSDLPLYQLAGGEEITGGAGQKIYDFVDAGVKNPTRTFYGNDAKAGQPFTMDRHTTRDMGYLDETYLNFLKENYKVPKDLKVDFEGAPSETVYEFGGDIGRKLTDELNAQGFGEKYGIGELSASDTQAIGWAAMLKLYDQPFDDLSGAISKNVQRVSSELSFGDGSPLAAKFGEEYNSLNTEQQYQITRDAMDWVSNRASELSGTISVGRVHGSGGWENFPPAPAVVENLLASPGGADIYADTVGYLANQTEVWAVREVSKNAQDANGILLDIVESGSKNIEDGDNLQAIWRKLNEYNPEVFQGYQPLSYEGKSGIRVIVPFKYNPFKNKPALRKYVEDNTDELIKVVTEVFPESKKFDINLADGNIRFHNNDWTESKNGESYLQRLERSTDGEIARSLRVSDGPEFEAFLQGLFDSTKRTTGTDTGIPKTEVRLRGVTPPKSTVSPNNSPPRTAVDKAQAKSDAQAILNQPGKMDESSFINKFTDNPNAAFWNKAELDKIKTEAGYGPDGIQDTFRAVRKANLKATIREMKKDGWDVQHTSTDSGKVSSYYLNKGGVDGPTIRVSDHELPETPERTHNRKIFGKPGWDEEFIINSKSSIERIKKEVKDYLEWFNDV